jgi:2-polyprenyl-3-methyl-5-hydroxy-6-metoxy-1,4-benzoquinol methylase
MSENPGRRHGQHYLRCDGRILEAGTGGGRIFRALAQLGFEHISGFDSVPDLIEQARRHDPSRAAASRVLDD